MFQKFRTIHLLLWLFLLPLLAQPVLGADATSFDPTKVAVEAKSSGGVPVGTIISWPVATNPEDMDNWLECNGQSISPSVYPELFAVVGDQVPDLRGLFLRGHGGNSAALGIRQEDTVGPHSHNLGFTFRTLADWEPPDDLPSPVSGDQQTRRTGDGIGIETRPVNTAVRYLVRARP